MLSLFLILLSPSALAADVELASTDLQNMEICGNEVDDNSNEYVDGDDAQCIALDESLFEECGPLNPCDEAPPEIGVDCYGGGCGEENEIDPPDRTFIQELAGVNTTIFIASGGKLPAGTYAFTTSEGDARTSQKKGLGYAFAAITMPDDEASTTIQAYDFGHGPQVTVHDNDNDDGYVVLEGQHAQ